MLSWPETLLGKEMQLRQGKERPTGVDGDLIVSAALWELVPS